MDYNSQAGGRPFTSSARASHRNSSSWCSRGGRYFVTAELPGEKTTEQNLSEKCKQSGEYCSTKRLLPGIKRWQLFYEIASGFERCLFAGKKRSFSKLSRRGVQDVGLRQRGLGGIPVGAVKLDS
ncbi:hypothetical protein PFLUV_G00121710 [Perca fluviatilis]|uniref:Uncharacterized protein n=1 Tax=Perca fluviatilis TaxID=8168 RepID=A0A6A5F676_PERFL|nr:hypothetical protein PFLUV_G00121710 [Perca fluviatilis]